MPKYMILKNVSTNSQRQLVDFFDLHDAAKWNSLLEEAIKIRGHKIRDKFPANPPADFNLWLELYKFLPEKLYSLENEELQETALQWQIKNNEGDEDCDPSDPYIEINVEE